MPETPEDRARREIDADLTAAGWLVQDRDDIDLAAGRGIAVRGFPMKPGFGFADYLLYLDRRALGAVEAKAHGTLSGVEAQSAKYAAGLPDNLPAHRRPLPFLFEANGSVIYFTNGLDPTPRSRPVFNFPRPEMLAEWVRQPAQLRARLQALPQLDTSRLWTVQGRAIGNLEESFADADQRALIQMATGSGKTFTAVNVAYRLLKFAGAKRILFLVDRDNLGKQAEDEFSNFEPPDDPRKFPTLYTVQRLKTNSINPASKVVITSIGEVATVVGGGTPDTRTTEYFGGQIAWLTPADLSGYTAKYISAGTRSLTQAGLDNSGAQILPSGSVLFSSRAPIGYVAIAAHPVCTNQGFKSFVLEEGLKPDFVYYYLLHAKPVAIELASGTTFLELSGRNAAKIPIPVPPFGEQERIADALDELFSDVDAGVVALERVREKLKLYRASVLKAAVEGVLTAEWRAQHPHTESADKFLERTLVERRRRWEDQQLAKFKAQGQGLPRNWKANYKRPATPDVTNVPPPPEGWCWAAVEQIGEVRLGRQRAPQHQRGDHMRPYLRVANVYEDRLDLRDVKQMNFTPEEFATYALRSGDILLNEGQSPELVGRPALYRDEIPGCCYQKTLLRFRGYGGLVPTFALSVISRVPA